MSLREVARTVVEDQYFRGLHLFAYVAVALVVVGIVLVIRRADARKNARYFAFLVLWCLIPTGLLVLTHVVGFHELYYWRYLAFTTPAVALLISTGLGRLPRAACLAGVVIVGIVAAPAFMERNNVMQTSSWYYAAQVMSERAQAGDGWISVSQQMPAVAEMYPRAFRGIPLLNDRGPDFSPGMLALRGGPLRDTFVAPADMARIWYFSDSFGFRDKGHDFALLEKQGFHLAWTSRERVGPNDLTIYLFERPRP